MERSAEATDFGGIRADRFFSRLKADCGPDHIRPQQRTEKAVSAIFEPFSAAFDAIPEFFRGNPDDCGLEKIIAV